MSGSRKHILLDELQPDCLISACDLTWKVMPSNMWVKVTEGTKHDRREESRFKTLAATTTPEHFSRIGLELPKNPQTVAVATLKHSLDMQQGRTAWNMQLLATSASVPLILTFLWNSDHFGFSMFVVDGHAQPVSTM